MGRPADHRGAAPAGRRREGKDFTMGKLNEQYTSSLQLAVAILGGKWKLRSLWCLQSGPLRFTDLMRRIPEVCQKSLTQQLRELEGHKIIKRKVYAEIPPRVEYSLTEHGLHLRESLCALNTWAHNYAAAEHITVLPWVPPQDESRPAP